MAPKNGPPDRWMDYSPMGDRIAGTRFICMKVPLKPNLSRYMDENEKFSCESAMQMVTAKGFKLGLVVDLSFTRKYYNPTDFEEKNVKYKKIFMPGQVLPKKEIINSFYEAVDEFEDKNHDNEDLIAVHCTHGLNRTGYMICRYLIDKKNFQPQDAINAFEKARGHKIERHIYLDDILGKTRSPSPSSRYQTVKPSLERNEQQASSCRGWNNLPPPVYSNDYYGSYSPWDNRLREDHYPDEYDPRCRRYHGQYLAQDYGWSNYYQNGNCLRRQYFDGYVDDRSVSCQEPNYWERYTHRPGPYITRRPCSRYFYAPYGKPPQRYNH